MKAFFSLVLGIVIGLFGYRYLERSAATHNVVHAQEAAPGRVAESAPSIRGTLATDRIKEELNHTGRVIREKARQAGDVIADAAANARVTAAIKTKLVEDSGLAAFKIDVDTTDGVVTLSGQVSSHAQVARAMELALETEGVYKVISTLQVKT